MAVAPEELVRFCQLLRALLCGHNEQRRESERLYQETKQCDPDRLCRCLITVLTSAPEDTLRQQSAVLLRQCLKATRADFVWPLLPAETREAIKSGLLTAMRGEQVRSTRHKVCDVVAVLASHVLDSSTTPGGWSEVGPALYELMEAQSSEHRESALHVVREMMAVNPPVVQALVGGRIPSVLQACQADPSAYVRKEAVLLFAAALEHLPQGEWQAARGLLPGMLAVVQQFERSPAELAECLQAFVQVVEVAPSAFSQHMNAVVPMMLAICRARDPLDDSVRQMAFEFLTSLIEKRTRACAKLPSFIREMVTLCMELMLELEDVEDWSEADRDDGAPDASNYEVGEEGIDRVARALGPEAVLGHVFANVREYVNHADWKRKYVAMMTLSQCAETVQDEAHVDEIARLLVSLLSDGHPRVRFAALHAIGQTAADHTPYLQETHHELIMPALSRLMDDPVVKVAAHSCAAFLNFAEDLGKTELLPYVPQLMAKLCPKIISPARVAKEQAITAVAVIAGVIEEDFVPYYRQVMEVLKQVMLTATAREERALRGKAFECMSLLGMAVGRDVFKHDAREAMEAMMLIAGKGLDTDDPQKSYIQEAAQRICRALREDFLPYLPHLLPGVYATLQMQPSEVLDPDALDEEEDMTLSYLQSGKAVGLRTSQIEDFRSAVQMLACFLEVLGGHFFDHLQDAARCLLPALSFGFCDDVKREATQTWQELIGAAKAGLQLRGIRDDGALVSGLLRAYLQRTVEAMRSEEDTETLQAQAVGTGICIRAAGPGSMTEAEVGELCVQVRALLGEATERQVPVPERGPQGEQGWEEDDEAEAEEQREAEQMLRVKYAELLGALMEVHTRAFLSVGMQSVLPVVQEYLAAGRGASDRCLALYICGDMLEKLGQESVPVWPAFMQQALGAVADADAWVRQAAAYCVFHGARLEQFSPLAAPVAKALAQLLARPAARRDGREFAEAAVAALGQLCLHQAPSLRAADPDRLLGLFLDGLPIWEDADVASPSHEALLTLAQQGHPLLKQRASQVFRVLLEVYGSETSSDALNAGTRHAVLEAGEGLLQLQPPLPQKLLRRAQKIQRESKRKR